jgi:carbonic anhydrase
MIKKIILTLIIILVATAATFYYMEKKQMKHANDASNLALQSLKQGNARFTSGKMLEHNYSAQIKDTKTGQSPKAVVLSCMDSRSIPELAFDQGIGDIFTLRIAGNVINKDILGSMEFGTKVVGAKVIVVLGHTQCAAVAAACQNDKLGNLTDLLQEIRPAVVSTEKKLKTKSCAPTMIDAVAQQNVINMVHRIPQQSKIIAELVHSGQLKIIGAMYDVATGKVTFIEDTPIASRNPE